MCRYPQARQSSMLTPNPPVNADARDVPAPAKAAGARAGYRAR
jgi:hypothetical protein